MNILNIPMDDLEAVKRYYEQQGKVLTQDEYQILMRCQTSLEEFDKLTKTWNIVESNLDLPQPPPGLPRP